jgi:DNA mismatch repair protein MutS2
MYQGRDLRAHKYESCSDSYHMNVLERTFKALEWQKLVNYLSEACETGSGKGRCLAMTPSTDAFSARLLLAETKEAKSVFEQHAFPSLTGLPVLDLVLERVSTGATLDALELLSLKRLLELTRSTRAALTQLESDAHPSLLRFLSSLRFVMPLYQNIIDKIDDKGNIKDTASPKLMQLRNELAGAHAQIKSILNAIIHSKQESKCLQEPIFTQRNGRYVLPVVAGMRGSIKGIVHDTSVSGSTIFVEPESVIDSGNRVRIAEVEIEREIERILSALSAIAREHLNDLALSFSALIDLDIIFAKARLGITYAGTVPAINDEPGFDLRGVRHPLLLLQNNADEVVANDVHLGKAGAAADSPSHEVEKRTLVITGPNTGGKTVLLKTIGLFALMLRAGMMIPAQPGSTMSLFDEILADIGDDQSLEKNLSTFSSHLTNIIEIVRRARAGCLILLDEIGAGTDPREGSALAQAELEYLDQSGALTIVTTHMNELKTLAYTDGSFANGSFEFDRVDFRPTYQFKLGTPGASHATRIASRLGLSEGILKRTEELLTGNTTSLDDTIRALEMRMDQTMVREEAAKIAEERSTQAEAEFRLRYDEFEKANQKERSSLSQNLQDEFSAAKEMIRHIIAELQREPTSAKAQNAKEQLQILKDELGWINDTSTSDAKQSSTFKQGDPVNILSLNQHGRIEKVVREAEGDKSALYEVRAGHLKFIVSSTDVKAVDRAKPVANGPRKRFGQSNDFVRMQQPVRGANVFVRSEANTLDLRGMRVDEALDKLAHFVDTSVLNGLSLFMIIHGHGTGALKRAVRDTLSQSNYSVQFRPGETFEGGDGVTLVSLN